MSEKHPFLIIRYTKKADKFFSSHEDVRSSYEENIRGLANGTAQPDVRKIAGKHGLYYRMRIGDYRVVYTVIDGNIVVIDTLLAGPRGDIYKKMSGLN